MRNIKRDHLLIIVSLFLLYAISNYFWLSQNRLPIHIDEGDHLWINMRFLRAFIHPAHNILYDLFHANFTYGWPSLFHFIASLFNLIFGKSYIVSLMTNMIFFLLLIVSLYLIGRRIHSPSAGIWAVIILSFYPIIYGHSRLFILDFALTAVVTFSAYALISTEKFKNLHWSIIFWLTIVIGLFTKINYLIFILPLLAYACVECLLNFGQKDFWQRVRNLLIPVAVAGFITLFRYINNRYVYILAFYNYINCIKIPPRIFYECMEDIPKLLTINNAILLFPFLLISIFSLLLFYIKRGIKYKLFLTVGYLVPLLVLAPVSWFTPRYLLPIFPYFALISAIGLSSIKSRKFRRTIFLLIAVLGVIQYFIVSFVDISNIRKKPEYRYQYSIIGAGHPMKTDWKHEDIAKSLARHIKSYPFIGYIGIICEENVDISLVDLFSNRVMNYYLLKELMDTENEPLGDRVIVFNKYDELPWFVKLASDMQGLIYISKHHIWPTLDEVRKFYFHKENMPEPIKSFIDNLVNLSSSEIMNITKSKQKPSLESIKSWIDDLVNAPRLEKLINSQENFSLINRIELPHNYYANIFLYKIPDIRKDDLILRMINGKIKIFYKDKEITKGIGLASEFAYNNKVYTYQDAILDFYNVSPCEVKMVFRWPKIGIAQSVYVSIYSDRKNTANIKVNMESQNNITIDSWHIDALVSNEYKKWTRPFSKGIFREIPMFRDRFEPLDRKYSGNSLMVGIYGSINEKLPAILFKPKTIGGLSINGEIANSDYYNNARCVYMKTASSIYLDAKSPKDILDMDISILNYPELETIISKAERALY